MKIESDLSSVTTPKEEWSYIVITLRETLSIVFHRVFPQKSINLWKLRKTNKWLKKHG